MSGIKEKSSENQQLMNASSMFLLLCLFVSNSDVTTWEDLKGCVPPPLFSRSRMWKPLISGWLCVCSLYSLLCWNMLGLILSPGNRRSSYAWGEDKGGRKRQVFKERKVNMQLEFCACCGYRGLYQRAIPPTFIPDENILNAGWLLLDVW